MKVVEWNGSGFPTLLVGKTSLAAWRPQGNAGFVFGFLACLRALRGVYVLDAIFVGVLLGGSPRWLSDQVSCWVRSGITSIFMFESAGNVADA